MFTHHNITKKFFRTSYNGIKEHKIAIGLRDRLQYLRLVFILHSQQQRNSDRSTNPKSSFKQLDMVELANLRLLCGFHYRTQRADRQPTSSIT